MATLNYVAPHKQGAQIPETENILADLRVASARIDFSDLIRKSHGELHKYAMSLTRDREEAADLVQDTIERAWKNRDYFEPGTNFGAWIRTIQHNVHVNNIKRRRKLLPLDEAPQYTPVADHRREIAARQELLSIKQVWHRLPREYRETILLIAEDYTFEEIAAAMGAKRETVRTRIFRARHALQRLIRRSESAPPFWMLRKSNNSLRKLDVFARDGGRCRKCGKEPWQIQPLVISADFCTIDYILTWDLDHIIPLADGGTDDNDNCQTLCRPCHRAKTSAENSARTRGRRRRRR